jgi:hypothetical protein
MHAFVRIGFSMNGIYLGYSQKDCKRLKEIAPHRPKVPSDLRKIIDWFGYLSEWRDNYNIQSVRSSLHSTRITCIDAAILSYGLLEFYFPEIKRGLLAIHRKDMHGEECGHCVTLYWSSDGRVGALSKSSFEGLGHRDAIFFDEGAIARSFAQAYVRMKFVPLFYGVTTLEEVAQDLDWRLSIDNLNILSSRLIERYQYRFDCE